MAYLIFPDLTGLVSAFIKWKHCPTSLRGYCSRKKSLLFFKLLFKEVTDPTYQNILFLKWIEWTKKNSWKEHHQGTRPYPIAWLKCVTDIGSHTLGQSIWKIFPKTAISLYLEHKLAIRFLVNSYNAYIFNLTLQHFAIVR